MHPATMKKQKKKAAAVERALSAAAAGLTAPELPISAPRKRPWKDALQASQRAFGLPLAGRVFEAAGRRGKNAVVSPLSIQAALALAAAGASGATLEQMLAVLGAGGSADDLAGVMSCVVRCVLKDRSKSGGPELAFAGGVWADASIALRPAFEGAAQDVYKADAKTVDFRNKPEEALEQINLWAYEATKHVIKSVLSPGSVTQSTRFVLGNALYFKGRWEEKFDTRPGKGNFHRLDGSSVKVAFMEDTSYWLFAEYDDFKVVKFPYRQGKGKCNFAMHIFLPIARDGVFQLTEKLTSEPSFLDQHLPTEAQRVYVRVPKFKISYATSVTNLLQEMGLLLPFRQDADFSNMLQQDESSEPLSISGVFHKAFVEVNEEGTEAAAVTLTATFGAAMPSPLKKFVAKHPFVFVIREDVSGAVMFMGHVLDPTLEG